MFLSNIAAWDIEGMVGTIFAVPVLAMLRVLFDVFAARLQLRHPDALLVLEAVPPTDTTSSPRADSKLSASGPVRQLRHAGSAIAVRTEHGDAHIQQSFRIPRHALQTGMR